MYACIKKSLVGIMHVFLANIYFKTANIYYILNDLQKHFI